jgi:hypothetical protein
MTLPLWAWAGTFALFAVLLVADLVLTPNGVGLRSAARSSAPELESQTRGPVRT